MHPTCTRYLVIKPLFALLLVMTPLTGINATDTEEPLFNLVSTMEKFEIREYEPQLVAETRVTGNRKEASSEGFRVLADFIFGNNTAQKKIDMTAPVSQQPAGSVTGATGEQGEEIAMTSPVTQMGDNNEWTIRFTMPAEYTEGTLPTPNNPAVIVKQIPAKRFAVLAFSGFAVTETITEKSSELLDAVDSAGIETNGEVELAQYDPPWIPGPQRRNEILIEVIE